MRESVLAAALTALVGILGLFVGARVGIGGELGIILALAVAVHFILRALEDREKK